MNKTNHEGRETSLFRLPFNEEIFEELCSDENFRIDPVIAAISE